MKSPIIRYVLITTIAWCGVVPSIHEARATSSRSVKFDRPSLKEPTYKSPPKYSLLVLGSSGGTKIWMVEDGKRLFIDKNANGDLTDDGPPIEPSNVRSLTTNSWDFNYLLDAITPTNGSRHTSFNLRRWNYGEPQDSYGLSISLYGKLPAYAGWFGTFWSDKREAAPIIHFGGPLTPRLLRSKTFALGPGQRRLSLAFVNPGSGPGADSRLSIDALHRSVIPKLNIEWPTAKGSPPLRTSQQLTERCCYWEFYTTAFETPSAAVVGTAKVTVELPVTETPIELTTTEFEVPVVAESKDP